MVVKELGVVLGVGGVIEDYGRNFRQEWQRLPERRVEMGHIRHVARIDRQADRHSRLAVHAQSDRDLRAVGPQVTGMAGTDEDVLWRFEVH